MKEKVKVEIGFHKYFFDSGITVKKAKILASFPKEVDFFLDDKIMDNNDKIYPNMNIKVKYNLEKYKNGNCNC